MSSRRRLWLAAFSLLLLLACTAQWVHAAGSPGENPAEGPVGTVFRWLNFAVVAGLLVYASRKWMAPALRKRSVAIGQAIAGAAAVKAEAERQLRETEAKLAQLDREVAGLRAAAIRESAAETERLRARAREEAEKIERAAQLEIEAAERAARMELKGILARLAVERAHVLIRERLDGEARARLFQGFLGDLARRAN